MKPYCLQIYCIGTCRQVSKLAKELSSCYKVSRAGITILVTFESDSRIEAAEYSRDVMNTATEKGGDILSAYLRLVNPNATIDKNYVADWEFKRCKGFDGDDDHIDGNMDEYIRRTEMLDLK